MQPRKVEAVTGWPRPRTRWELQRFLGFVNFFRRFIKSFSTLAWPLTDLLRWGEVTERAFAALKTAFSTSPVLQQPNPERPFIVEVDASDVGVGAVLSQARWKEGKLGPIAYFSRKLSPSEWNYGVGDRELLAGSEKRQHHAEAQSSSQELVLPLLCFLATVTWDINHSIEATDLYECGPPPRMAEQALQANCGPDMRVRIP
ncbi:hypothetical protein P4O66_001520 [Electrophorus voltai]|uniref:Reverse transcriptase/retrotransposon-derived protein RNase H-like domain-containing protein n=1 Tax=Electrophorus voltai TaxID=2609070 RepID=A0AAD8Z7E3_9TELE|nr:hypothetical protein P4O66_001520 [Electrophorus voltai]